MNVPEKTKGPKLKLATAMPDDNDRGRAQLFLTELLGGLAAKPEAIPARLAEWFAASRLDEVKRQRQRSAAICRAGFDLSTMNSAQISEAVAIFSQDPVQMLQRMANGLCKTLADRILSDAQAPEKRGEEG